MNKRIIQTAAIALAIMTAWIAGTYSVAVTVRPEEARAAEYQQLKVQDQYVYLDNTVLDLAQKPVLMVDASSDAIIELVKQIPSSKQPALVLCKDTAEPVPDFMTGLEYSICLKSELSCPALLTWNSEEGLQGYMFNAVNEHLYEWGYPCLIGLGQVYNNTSEPSGNNSWRASEQSQFVVVQPGQEYSFYDYVLPSVEAGYQEGLSIFADGSGGYTWGADLGGGICKTATVLHYAVQDAGLTETERNHHSLQVSYALPGDDAAVSRDSADYRFVNTLSNPIVIVFQQTENRLMAGIYEVVDPATARADICELMIDIPWEFDCDPILISVPLVDVRASTVTEPANESLPNESNAGEQPLSSSEGITSSEAIGEAIGEEPAAAGHNFTVSGKSGE